MRGIERRLRRLERHRAAEDFDAIEVHQRAVEAYENGEPIPESFTGEARSIAEAIYSMLHHLIINGTTRGSYRSSRTSFEFDEDLGLYASH
jgi:hypothetical protein